MDNKTDLRIWAKSVRKSLNLVDISERIVSKIRLCDLYRKSKNVMLFYPTKYEINLLQLLEDDKNFYLPKVCGEELLVCPFKIGDTLELSKFKIKEPCLEPVDYENLDLIIVPALAADKCGYRLGYGGGFYDRFLKKCKAKTIVPISHELLLEKLSIDEFDVPVDIVITDL